ncbi:hypothetical protein COU88_00310 [Candidatus Roizmanbacteria bacterium CG10_big_fil_rev_8_21_14_0_10_39_6]|uniref:DUF4446 domain-containing protein n=1 Tax=Candidatus Roizmanbacteria bacterium CG10_big_fil_rev_8_21_14_0_10_39_6 TaxID=1974853 RepID=A0A2M8KTP1_9BACT|nr:MAG: hypothetical protein COU88_00310 [Candidatus Roizmanbacteria bacterium CG10_big_fil_rev_8_21_14_0_10_39_6]
MSNIYITILGVWLFVVTVGVVYIVFILKNLFPYKQRGIKHAIDEVFGRQEKNKELLEGIQKELNEEKKKGVKKLSRYGFVRFNPFERLGGEQSYCFALMDEEGGGVIMTFLFTREGMRVYMKQVENGKGKESELSQEEKKAVVKAGFM